MASTQDHGWTQERWETARRLWMEGKSASEIARTLRGGCTRNAVIGKIFRAGLSGVRGQQVSHTNRVRALKARMAAERLANPHPPKPVKAPKPPRVEKPVLRVVAGGKAGSAAPAPRPAPAPAIEAPQPLHLTMMQLSTGKCRWPIGEGEGMTFCGCATPDVTDPVQPYCAYHRGLAFHPSKPRLRMSNARPSWERRPATRSEMFRHAAGGR